MESMGMRVWVALLVGGVLRACVRFWRRSFPSDAPDNRRNINNNNMLDSERSSCTFLITLPMPFEKSSAS